MNQLEKLKTRLDVAIDDTSQNVKLECILEDVEAGLLEATNRTVLLPSMNSLQIELAIIAYNKQASEGVSSSSQGGVSQSWIDGLPQDLHDRLISYRRLKVSNYATKKS